MAATRARRLCIRCDAELRVEEFDHADIPFCRGCLPARSPTAAPPRVAVESLCPHVPLPVLALMGLTGLASIGTLLADGSHRVSTTAAVLGVFVTGAALMAGYVGLVLTLAIRGLRERRPTTRRALIARLDLADAVGRSDIPSRLARLSARPAAETGLVFRAPGGLVFFGPDRRFALPWARIRGCSITMRTTPKVELDLGDGESLELELAPGDAPGAAARFAHAIRVQVLANELTA